MKKAAVLLAAAVMLWVLSTAQATGWPQSMHTEMRTDDYFKLTEATIIGEVESMDTHEHDPGMKCFRLILTTGTETLVVHVAPAEFLEKNKIKFTRGETLEIIGSRIKEDNVDALLPREIKQGPKTIMLRDRDGRPLWAVKHVYT